MKRLTLWRVFWRTLFIQAGFSQESMQTLGLLYALEPALKELYPEPAALKAAVERHLATFNTHPYVAAAIIGGVLFHEAQVARGEEPPERVARFKSSLMGPMAALGDGFFWLSLRPFVGAFSALLSPWLHAWAALVYVVLFNAVHFTLRARFFWLGYTRGDGLVQGVGATNLPRFGRRLRLLAAGCSGALGAFLATRFGALVGGLEGVLLAGVCLFAGMLTVVLSARRVSPYVMLYLGAALAIAFGVLR